MCIRLEHCGIISGSLDIAIWAAVVLICSFTMTKLATANTQYFIFFSIGLMFVVIFMLASFLFVCGIIHDKYKLVECWLIVQLSRFIFSTIIALKLLDYLRDSLISIMIIFVIYVIYLFFVVYSSFVAYMIYKKLKSEVQRT